MNTYNNIAFKEWPTGDGGGYALSEKNPYFINCFYGTLKSWRWFNTAVHLSNVTSEHFCFLYMIHFSFMGKNKWLLIQSTIQSCSKWSLKLRQPGSEYSCLCCLYFLFKDTVLCGSIWIGIKGNKNVGFLSKLLLIATFTVKRAFKLLPFPEILKLFFFQDCFIYFALNFIFGFWAKKYLINVCVPTLFPWKSHSGLQTDALQILRVLRGSNSVKCLAFPVFTQDYALLIQFLPELFLLSQTLCGILQKCSSQFLSFQNFPEGNSTQESKYTFGFHTNTSSLRRVWIFLYFS